MRRPGPTPSNAEYIVGPVRVVRSSRGFRILWYEGDRQRERLSQDLDRAKEIAREQEARLASTSGVLSTHDVPVAALVSAATDPANHQWTTDWANRVERLVRIHIIPALGPTTARNLTKAQLISILQRLADDGYSTHTITKVRQLLGKAMDEGVKHGLWRAGGHPLVGVKVPRTYVGNESGRPDLRMVPTDSQVLELINRMADDRPIYGVMAQVAAHTGVRWGELAALTVGNIDLDQSGMTVNLNCVEGDNSRFLFRPPGKPSDPAPSREIRLDSTTVSTLRGWLSSWQPKPAGIGVDGPTPLDLVFQAANGNPFRRSNFRHVVRRHVKRIEGWPEHATWHYLRHYCATWWLRLGIEVPTVSKMLGHSQVSTTYDWYVNVDAEAMDRAADKLP